MNLQQAMQSAFHVVPFAKVPVGARFRPVREQHSRSKYEWWDRQGRRWCGATKPPRMGRRRQSLQFAFRGYETVKREYPVMGPAPEYVKQSGIVSVDPDGRDAIFGLNDEVVLL